MGSQWVEDPSWGNIFSGFASELEAAPGKALNNIALGEKIKDARIARQREQLKFDADTAASQLVDPSIPQAVAPQVKTYAPFVGDINNPSDIADVPIVDYQDPRLQALAESQRRLMVASGRAAALSGRTSEIPGFVGQGTVAATGVPSDPAQRGLVTTQLTGKLPDEKEKTPHNWVQVGPDGLPVAGSAVSSSTRPGRNYILASPASTTAPNPYENKAVALNGLAKIEADRQKNGVITEDQARMAQRLFDVAHPRTRVVEQEGGRSVEKSVVAEPIPPSLMPLFRLADDYANGRHLQPPVTAQPGAAAQPGATAPPPGATPLQSIDPNASRVTSKGAANPAEMRKEYLGTQQISDWNTTVPVFNSAVKSAQAPTNQQDINIIYAFAKLMDPGSVVRESEVKLASSSGTVLDTIGGLFQKLTTGGGTMTPDVRQAIIDTLQNRMQQYKSGKDMMDRFYREKVAPASGLNPDEVIPPTMEPTTYNRDEFLRAKPPSSVPRRAADDITGVR
jgi:hypothetical protein